MSVFKKILVPVDGSATANKALELALQMANQDRALVRLLHCIDETSFLDAYEYSSELIKQARQAGQKILQEAQGAAHQRGVNADTLLLERAGQRLGQSVVEVADDWGADLLVVGSHGRRGIGRLLLGSGSEQILRDSHVPVLLVRGSD